MSSALQRRRGYCSLQRAGLLRHARIMLCRVFLNVLVQLGFHCKALAEWAEAVQTSAAVGAAGGASPYAIAVANGFTGRRFHG